MHFSIRILLGLRRDAETALILQLLNCGATASFYRSGLRNYPFWRLRPLLMRDKKKSAAFTHVGKNIMLRCFISSWI